MIDFDVFTIGQKYIGCCSKGQSLRYWLNNVTLPIKEYVVYIDGKQADLDIILQQNMKLHILPFITMSHINKG